MSEFSASCHLRTENQAAAVKLIKDSGNTGYVYEETNGWVTFLIEGAGLSIDRKVIECNPGLLVHYIYAEDHGWELRIYNKDELVFEYGCDWTDDIQITKSVFDLELIQEIIIGQGNQLPNLEALFNMTEFDDELPPAYILAESFGLVNYEWVSADYMDSDELDEGVTYVD